MPLHLRDLQGPERLGVPHLLERAVLPPIPIRLRPGLPDSDDCRGCNLENVQPLPR